MNIYGTWTLIEAENMMNMIPPQKDVTLRIIDKRGILQHE